MFLFELAEINCASSKRVTVTLKESFVTWNDLVLAVTSSKEKTRNHFWQMSSFLKNFFIGQTFTSYDRYLCLNWFE